MATFIQIFTVQDSTIFSIPDHLLPQVVPHLPFKSSHFRTESHPETKSLGEKVGSYVVDYIEALEKVKLKQGLKTTMAISTLGNGYLQETRFWKLYKEDPASCSIVLRTSAGLVYLLAALLEPYMPSFSRKVLKQLNLETLLSLSLSPEKVKRSWEFLPAGQKIGTPAPLFKELKDDEVAKLRDKFAGSQADRKLKAEAEANSEYSGKVKKKKGKSSKSASKPSSTDEQK